MNTNITHNPSMDPNVIQVGDTVYDSGIGPGVVTGHSERGYPQVERVTVARLIRTDGAVFDPHDKIGGSRARPTEFQPRVKPWMIACFGPTIPFDKVERNHRFLEEAIELVQAGGCTASEAHQLVDYVFGRPVGELSQEVGGVMVTLAALCIAHDVDMHADAETELARIWTKVEQIRAKQASKPKHSPLPEVTAAPPAATHQERVVAERDELAARLERLAAFTQGAKFNDVDMHERRRLLDQQWVMGQLLHILNTRIAAFTE